MHLLLYSMLLILTENVGWSFPYVGGSTGFLGKTYVEFQCHYCTPDHVGYGIWHVSSYSVTQMNPTTGTTVASSDTPRTLVLYQRHENGSNLAFAPAASGGDDGAAGLSPLCTCVCCSLKTTVVW